MILNPNPVFLVYPGLAVIGELGSDTAILPRFLLVMFLCLPFAILLSLSLVGLVVTGWFLNLLWACKAISAPLHDCVSHGTDCWCAALLLGALEVVMWPAPSCLCNPGVAHLLLQGVMMVDAAGTFSKCWSLCRAVQSHIGESCHMVGTWHWPKTIPGFGQESDFRA